MGGWIAGGVRELKGLENGENWGVKTHFRFSSTFTHFATNRPRQVCSCEIVMYSAKLQVTLFILVHLPCIHLLHSVQHSALDTTLFPHIPQGLILQSAITFSVPLTIILVSPIFAFNRMPSIALLNLWNFALKSSKYLLNNV